MTEQSNPATILVVDDEPKMEPMFKLRFRKKIAAEEFHFVFALSAKEALVTLEQNPAIDIVLLDINMPGMDGLTLLPKLIALDDTLRVVMVSAYGDMKNIRRAMNLGAFDFVTKPIDFSDLETTINAVECDLVIIGTPIDLNRVVNIQKPSVRVTYELQEIGSPNLNTVLKPFTG